jgi:hypothetical protein
MMLHSLPGITKLARWEYEKMVGGAHFTDIKIMSLNFSIFSRERDNRINQDAQNSIDSNIKNTPMTLMGFGDWDYSCT